MHFYDSAGASSGVTPASDQNQPTPPNRAGDPLQKPGFLQEYEEELVAVRNELSELFAKKYKARSGSDMPMSVDAGGRKQSVSGLERDLEYAARERKLSDREDALSKLVNQYKYVASLGDAPAVEDEPGEPTNAAKSGATSRVYSR